MGTNTKARLKVRNLNPKPQTMLVAQRLGIEDWKQVVDGQIAFDEVASGF